MIRAPGTVIAGRYRLERRLAEGGMGSVWVARHLGLDVDVALKLMAGPADERLSGRARFEREAKTASRLESPHVVRVLDHCVEGDTPFLVMELLSGESLADRLQRVGRLTLREVSGLLAQVCEAVQLAHDAGIVHRDLKPANIFLAETAGERIVKVLDFGIAKETSSSLVDVVTARGVLLGSLHHLSPEQARAGAVDHRSDLWSLGVVVFRALTGERPFAGATAEETIARICRGPIPVASTLRPDLPPEVDGFFERALARNPAFRFASARAMAEALRQIAEREPSREATASGPAPRLGGGDAPRPRVEVTAPLSVRPGGPRASVTGPLRDSMF